MSARRFKGHHLDVKYDGGLGMPSRVATWTRDGRALAIQPSFWVTGPDHLNHAFQESYT